jgi:1-phosphofructokinase
MRNEPRVTVDTLTITLNPAIDQTVTIAKFTTGSVNRVESACSNPGGKGVNVASMLADYGQRVAVSGFLGCGNTGSFEQLFAEKRIEDRFVRINGQTRVAIKVVDPLQQRTTDINFPGAAPSPDDLIALLEALGAIDAHCIVLAGSVPPGVEQDIYRRLIPTLKAGDRRIVLDTSEEPLRLALEAKPDLIKPNIHELQALLGRRLPDRSSVVSAARRLIERGIETVVISMGQDGACLVSANEAVIAVPPDVEVQSTVGAGDAMVAGMIAAQAKGLSLAECARLATAFSMHALTRHAREPGADPVASIGAFVPQVKVEAVS